MLVKMKKKKWTTPKNEAFCLLSIRVSFFKTSSPTGEKLNFNRAELLVLKNVFTSSEIPFPASMVLAVRCDILEMWSMVRCEVHKRIFP